MSVCSYREIELRGRQSLRVHATRPMHYDVGSMVDFNIEVRQVSGETKPNPSNIAPGTKMVAILQVFDDHDDAS